MHLREKKRLEKWTGKENFQCSRQKRLVTWSIETAQNILRLGVRNSWSKIPQKLHQQSFFLRSRAEKFSCDHPVTPRPCFRMVAIDWFSAGRNFDGRMLSIWTPLANAPFQHQIQREKVGLASRPNVWTQKQLVVSSNLRTALELTSPQDFSIFSMDQWL